MPKLFFAAYYKMATWSLPLEINNLTARVNALGSAASGVTNPLTSNLAAGGFSITGANSVAATSVSATTLSASTTVSAATVAATTLTGTTLNGIYVNGGSGAPVGTLVVGGSTTLPTGTSNTSVGIGSLAISNSANNTAVGFSALNTATGVSNTAVGTNAGKGLTSGYSNTFVGSGAGSEAVTTGYSNIYIGGASAASSAAVNNEVVVGATAAGFGPYTVSLGSSSPYNPYYVVPVGNSISVAYRTGYALNRMQTSVTYQCTVTNASNNVSLTFSTYGIYELIVSTQSTATVYGIWMCNNAGGAAFTALNTPVGVTAASQTNGMLLSGFPNGAVFFMTLTRKSFYDS